MVCSLAKIEDLERIAASLPGTLVSNEGQFALSLLVKGKARGFVWTWAERVHPKKSAHREPRRHGHPSAKSQRKGGIACLLWSLCGFYRAALQWLSSRAGSPERDIGRGPGGSGDRGLAL